MGEWRSAELLTRFILSSRVEYALFFSVVDIIAENNITFVLSDVEAEIIRGAFEQETHDSIANLGRRLSRKKELEPQVRAYLETI